MKSAIWSVSVSLALFSAQASPAQQAAGQSPASPAHFRLSLAAAGALKLGSPLMLNVTLTNITQSPIPLTFGPEPGYKFFQFTVTQSGAELHRTVLQRRLRGEPNMDDPTVADPGTSVSFQFPAGQSFTASVDLARLYDFTMLGRTR